MPVMDGIQASKLILRMVNEAINNGEEELSHIVVLTSFTNDKTHDECL